MNHLLAPTVIAGLATLTGATRISVKGGEKLEPANTAGKPETAKEYTIYVGTYTQKTSKGIYALRMNSETGKLTPLGLMAETENPSYLAIHPNHQYLYATNEVVNFEGTSSGAISAFAIDEQTGHLKQLNQENSLGGAPCDICLDPAGKFVLAANYTGGSIVAMPVQADGSLKPSCGFVQHHGSSVNKDRQEGPHAHCVLTDVSGRYVYCADLGLDKVLIYKLNPNTGVLTPNDPPDGETMPGAGPRHFKLHPSGRYGYVIDELDSTITAFAHDHKNGGLKRIQVISTLPTGFKGTNNPAELVIHRSGRFLYGSNRGHDSIVICSIDEETGKLTVVGHQSTEGKNPRNFTIDPSGRFLLCANQDTDNIVEYRIDQKTGKLTPTGDQVQISMPVCLVFAPR